jgi:hypothetical protein
VTSKKSSSPPTTDIVLVDKPSETKRTENLARAPEVGDWYWLKVEESDGWDDDNDAPLNPRIVERLTCVMHVGSNYVELTAVSHHDTTWRVHENEFDDECTYEPDPQMYINQKIALHQGKVNELLDNVKQLTARLGVTRAALPEGEVEESTRALAVAHGTERIQEHKKALIKAKEETLPDLFKKIEEEHKELAMWMKGGLLPHRARAAKLKDETSAIEDRIFTVELYAGLIEEIEQIKKGDPAHNDEKVRLFQRQHYMDEECLANYKAGGMEFKDLRAFERWLCKKENFERIFPHPRCVVTFRVRRHKKDRECNTLWDFIVITMEEKLDKRTFLYIRNGAQLWRMHTEINFGEELFPHKDDSVLLGDGEVLYADTSWNEPRSIMGEGQYLEMVARREREREEYEKKKRAWKRMSKKEREGKCEPWWSHRHSHEKWSRIDKGNVYYDDVMKKIAREAVAHNRVVVVLQGLLDRSPCLHPHPPWQLWTNEGFTQGLELIYDLSRALVDGDPPSFKAYCARLNAHMEKGCFTVGQQDTWLEHEREKEEQRRRNSYRYSYRDYDVGRWWSPYGNPGPGEVAKVVRLDKKRQCIYEWYRERQRVKWVKDPDRPGFMKYADLSIKTRFACPIHEVLNISAYKPGDYKTFYDDPRTREDYLEWAPWLLVAEDFHAGNPGGIHATRKKRREAERDKPKKKRSKK